MSGSFTIPANGKLRWRQPYTVFGSITIDEKPITQDTLQPLSVSKNQIVKVKFMGVLYQRD